MQGRLTLESQRRWYFQSSRIMRPFLTSFEALVPLAVTFGSLLGSTAALNPTIVLDNGTFTGVDAGVANKFLGIPFAKPP